MKGKLLGFLLLGLLLWAQPASASRNSSVDCGLDTSPCNYTVGAGTNRFLLCGMFGNGSGSDNPTLKWNTTETMTSVTGSTGVQGGGDRPIWMFYLVNPTSGAHTIAASFGSAPDHYRIMCADYDNVDQVSQPDQSGSNSSAGTTSLTVNLASVTANSWVWAVLRENSGGAVTWTAGASADVQSGGGLHIADSNAAVGGGSTNVTGTFGGSNITALIAISFDPAGGGGGGGTPPPYSQGMTILGLGMAVLIGLWGVTGWAMKDHLQRDRAQKIAATQYLLKELDRLKTTE